ncbi:hypothetical protein AVEN_132598-1 [Araneus ventricosus]|uniref:Uncharacterized protein n=1 Tax=Araneus ventricosus TaxID=182803 RepID=A0A4Y2AVA5_ARAVE|nr:hypothetical protein AVEN_132598-1 [Araneus ventricosus]
MQYLLQAVVPKTKAARVVESFPATAENYPKAIAQLKERFGRDDLLVQIYVRDCSAPYCHHLTVMFIIQYPPPDIGISFCLVVRIFGSGPKGPRFYSASKVVTRGQRTCNSNFQSHY